MLLYGNTFEHIAQLPANAQAIARTDGGEHLLRVRVPHRLLRIVAPVRPGGRNVDGRLRQHDGKRRQIGKAAQNLAAPRRQLRATRKAKGHVRADLGCKLCKRRLIQPLLKKLVHPEEHGSSIRRAARKPRRHRNRLFQANRYAARRRKTAQKERRRTPREIALVRSERRAFDIQRNALRRLFQFDLIRERDGLHDHLHLVIAVGTFPQDIERQVDLRPRQKLQQKKCTILPSIYRHKFYQFFLFTASLRKNLVGINQQKAN